MRILIVDDDYVSRSKLKALLSKYGDCDVVPNGDLALEMFRCAHAEAIPYDLISMDVNMPGDKGQEVVRKIRNWEAEHRIPQTAIEVKILMVTVVNDPHDITLSFRQGCEGYLIKPITPEKLKEALAKIEIKE
ncbi:MAG: response regulator [Lentisphaerota bacterium]